MSNLPMTIAAAVATWRAGRTAAQLKGIAGETLPIGDLAYRVTPLPQIEGAPLVVHVEVLGAGLRVLAESRVEISDA
jgi:hypothetical protein